MAVQDQVVFRDLESEPLRDIELAALDAAVKEFLDPPAVHAHDVVVMLALVQLENRGTAFEVMALDECGRLELGQHAIHGGEPDVLAVLQQRTIDFLGGQVAAMAAGQDLEDLDARQRDLEASLAKIAGFHGTLRRRGARRFRYDAPYHRPGLLTMRPPRPISGLTAVLLLAVVAAGCVYRMDIQQGNLLDVEQIDQVEVGMTRSQVRFLLGTPMVIDSFNPDRWDYVYRLQRGHSRKIEKRHLVVWFESDKVTRIEEPIALPRKSSAAAG